MIFFSVCKKIMYFITALIPSILLLEWFCPFMKVNKKIGLMVITVIISILIGMKLKKSIFDNSNTKSKSKAINFGAESTILENDDLKEERYIIDASKNISINNNFIPFLTSIVIPLFLKNDNWLISILTIIMLFIFSWNSSDCFPNIILSILRVHLISTNDGFYIFYRSKDKEYMLGIKEIYFINNNEMQNNKIFVFKEI